MNKAKYPLVSIVMPCYNSKDMVLNAVESVLKTHYQNFELIVVDDVSTDGTFKLLTKKLSKESRIKLIRNEKNFGPSRTRNRGIEEANGKYVAFVETDMEVDPGWLAPLVDAMESDAKLGGVQSKILDINKRSTIQTVGVLFDPHTFWVYPLGCGYGRDWLPKDLELGIGSVGSLMRKSLIDKIGGFDEKLVHNWDDIELGWRIWMFGYKTRTIPESITYHWTMKPGDIRNVSTPGLMSELHFHKTPRIFLKNYEWRNVLRYMPWLLFAYFLRICINLLKGNTKPLRGFLMSLIWEIKTLPGTFRERKRLQNLRKRSDKEMFKKLGLCGNFFQIYLNKMHFNILRGFEAFG
jgi:GT2 family glycosyltransferase